MNRSEKKTGLPVISEPQSLALKNIKSVQAAVQILETIRFYFILRRFIYERSVKHATIHLQEVTGHWRILSYSRICQCILTLPFPGH